MDLPWIQFWLAAPKIRKANNIKNDLSQPKIWFKVSIVSLLWKRKTKEKEERKTIHATEYELSVFDWRVYVYAID